MRAAEIQDWFERTLDQQRAGGVTAIDLLDLPPVLNQILRVLLAHGPMTAAQMRAALAALPDTLWLDNSDLSLALDGLIERHWLLCDSGAADPVYRVNLRAKARISAVTKGREALDF